MSFYIQTILVVIVVTFFIAHPEARSYAIAMTTASRHFITMKRGGVLRPVRLMSQRDAQIAPTVAHGLADARIVTLAKTALLSLQYSHIAQTLHEVSLQPLTPTIPTSFVKKIRAYVRDFVRAGMGL